MSELAGVMQDIQAELAQMAGRIEDVRGLPGRGARSLMTYTRPKLLGEMLSEVSS